jgi:hypothetical protein
LSGAFTAQIDVAMTVGGVSETVTVAASTPIVDVQSIRRQTTISNDVLTSIPTARSWAATALLIPGIVTIGGGPTDIQVTPQMTVFGGAGGRSNEGRMQVDGLNAGAGLGGSGVSTYIADISNAQEVVTTTSGGLGEVEVGGPSLSIIPKSGGNSVRGAAYLSGVSSGMVSSNYSDALRNAGLTTPGKLLRQWDYTFGIGAGHERPPLVLRDGARRGTVPVDSECLSQPEHRRCDQDVVCSRQDAGSSRRGKLAALHLPSHVSGVSPQQVQPALG